MKKIFLKIPKEILPSTIIFSLLQFLFYFNFFWLIQNVYLLDQGINFKQLSLLLGIWSLSIIILEIPSGIIADRLGRKIIIIMGKIGFLLGLLFFIINPSFLTFVFGMIMFGLHDSFLSGAYEALLYDNLKEKGYSKLFHKILSITAVSREIGLGIGVLIAGYLGTINMNLNLIGSIIIAVLGIIVAFFLPSVKPSKPSEESTYLRFFKDAVKTILNSKLLILIMIFSILVGVSHMVINEYFVVTFDELHINFSIIGILAFGETIFFIIGTYLARRYKSNNMIMWYLVIALVLIVSMFAIGTKLFYIVICGWYIIRSITAISEIIVSVDWQNNVRSVDRATVMSIKDFVLNIVYIPIAFLFGVFSDHWGLFKAFYFIAILPIIFVFFLLIKKIFIGKP